MKDLWKNRIRVSIQVEEEVMDYGHVLDPSMLEVLRAVKKEYRKIKLKHPNEASFAFHELDEAVKRRDILIQHLSSAIAHDITNYFDKKENK